MNHCFFGNCTRLQQSWLVVWLLMLGITPIAPTTALAACDATSPGDGATVTCDTSAPNPETDAIIAPGSTDVIVNILSGAQLQTATSPAINLGGRAIINMASDSLIADVDLSSIPTVIGDVIDGDFTGITTHQDLVDLYNDIRAQAPVRTTPADATIDLGVTAASQSNFVVVEGGTVISGGAGAIRSADNSTLEVTISEGGTVASVTENAPAVMVGDVGTLDVQLDDGAIATFFDGSAGVAAASDDSALSVIMEGDSRIYTAGDNAPAILGSGTESVFNMEVDRTDATEGLPAIATFGDNSPGILVHGSGDSDFALSLSAGSSTLGPAFQTNGTNSVLVDVDLGLNSSLSFAADSTSFGTFGDGSGVLNLHLGDRSDLLVFLEASTLTSQGNNASLLDISRGELSTVDVVVLDSNFQTQGDGSAGIVSRVTNGGDRSSDTTFLGNISVETAGAEASAYLVEEGGVGSVRTVDIFDSSFTTQGADSGGVSVGGLGAGSAFEINADSLTIDTTGANSAGLFAGGVGGDSAYSASFSNTTITTQGANSGALTILGVEHDSSAAALDFSDSNLSTAGDNSIGLFATMLRGTGGQSTAAASLDGVTVSTLGAGSTGIILGDASLYGDTAPNVDASSMAVSIRDVTVDTAGDDADGLIVYGLGAGATVTDGAFTVANTTVTTTGDRSRGIVMEVGSVGATDSTFTTVVNALDINTSGEEAHGLVLGEGLGTGLPTTSSTLSLSMVSATTTGNGANALVIGENTTLTLDDANFDATTADGTRVNGVIDSFDGFVATGEGGRAVHNDGIIYDTFTVSAPVVGNLANNGLIESADGAGGVAVQFTGTTDDIFELQPMGEVIGTVEAGVGTDTFILGGDGVQTFDQTLIGTQYNDFELFEKEDSSTWTLANHSATPLWEVREGELVVQNEFIDPIARGFTVHGGATLTITDTEPAGADTGADNRFEIHPDAVVNGDVLVGLGDDTFVLGGTGTATFDISLINSGTVPVSGAQYFGFNRLEKEDDSTWTLTGTNGLEDQPFAVNGGLLNMNATMQNALFTVDGGTLGGTGTAGSVTVNAGAFAPGNSIGTFTITGDLILTSAGTFEVEIEAPDQADLIVVGGQTTLDGTLSVIGISSAFADGQTYTVIDSAGAVSGSFAAVTDDLPDFGIEVDIVEGDGGLGEDVVLTLVVDSDLSDKAIVPNAQQAQIKTGRLFSAALGGRTDGRRSAQTAVMDDGTVNGYAAPAVSGPNQALGGLAIRPVRTAWVAGLGGYAQVNTSATASGYNADAYGLAGGMDMNGRTGSFDWLLGAALGYTASNVRSASSSADVSTGHLGIYGRIDKGAARLSARMSYGFQDYDFNRLIPVGTTTSTATGDADGHLFVGSVTGAYDIAPQLGLGQTHALRLAPAATLGYVYSYRGAFTETGAGIFNQSYTSDDFGYGFLRLGVEIGATTTFANGLVLRPRGGLHWEWHLGPSNTTAASTASAVAGSTFSSPGAVEGDGSLVTEAGFDLDFNSAVSMHFTYEGAFAGDSNQHRLVSGLKVRF